MRYLLLLLIITLMIPLSAATIPMRIYSVPFDYDINDSTANTSVLIEYANRLNADAIMVGTKRAKPRAPANEYFDGAPNQGKADLIRAEIDAVHTAGLQYIIDIPPNRGVDDEIGNRYHFNNPTDRALVVSMVQEIINNYTNVDGIHYEEIRGETSYDGLKAFLNETQFVRAGGRTLSFNTPQIALVSGDPTKNVSSCGNDLSCYNLTDIDNNQYVDWISLQANEWTLNGNIDSINNWTTVMPNTVIMSVIYGYTAATQDYCISEGYDGWNNWRCYTQTGFDLIDYYNAQDNRPVHLSQWIRAHTAAYLETYYPNRSQYIKDTYGTGHVFDVIGLIPVNITPSAPEVITQPVNGSNYTGGTIYFYVTAAGSTPLYYQWQKNGTNISGATSSSYTTPTLTVNDNHSLFRVLVWNGNGSIYSNNATATVLPPAAPIITIQPSNITAFVGYSATFRVAASGIMLTYQWQKNGINIPGAMNASYATLPATMLDNVSTYRVRVTNSEGSVTSNAATLTVQTNTNNFINNSGFESGAESWALYTNGNGTFSIASPGYEGNNSANVTLSSNGSNIQLYQTGITLEPETNYRLSFAAYSTTGHDVTVRLFKHVSPYTAYIPDYTADLGTTWQTFSTEFNTTGFSGTVNDGRIQFWLTPFVTAGDTYYFDDIQLENLEIGNSIYDLNNDGIVDSNDLAIVLFHFSENSTFPYPNYDINDDGKIDIYDMVLVANNI